MTQNQTEAHPFEDPHGQLERAFMEEFLRARGYDLQSVRELPDEQGQHLLREASLYAAAKLAELEARAHFVHEIHGEH